MDQLDRVNEDIRKVQILINSGMACHSELSRLISLRGEISSQSNNPFKKCPKCEASEKHGGLCHVCLYKEGLK